MSQRGTGMRNHQYLAKEYVDKADVIELSFIEEKIHQTRSKDLSGRKWHFDKNIADFVEIPPIDCFIVSGFCLLHNRVGFFQK